MNGELYIGTLGTVGIIYVVVNTATWDEEIVPRLTPLL